MNFSSEVLFNDINHGFRATILKKRSLWLLPFFMAVANIAIMKKCAEQCTLQLYHTSLSYIFDSDLETKVEKPLNGGKEKKDRKKYSQKANGDNKSQVTTILQNI